MVVREGWWWVWLRWRPEGRGTKVGGETCDDVSTGGRVGADDCEVRAAGTAGLLACVGCGVGVEWVGGSCGSCGVAG